MGWIVLLIASVWYGVASLVTLAMFTLDKLRAKVNARRTPEKVLHTCSAFGGFPGAIVAMVLVRHKNRKPGFVAITLAIAAAHVIVWVVGIVLWWVVR